MTRITWSGARLVGAVLLVGILEAGVTVPAAVWPDSYPPALAAALAIVVAAGAVALLAVLLRRRRRERELTVAELEAVRASLPAALAAVDSEGAIVDWNQAAEALYGYQAEEVLGQPLSLLGDEDALEAIRSGEHFADSEAVHRRKDGSELRVALTVAPIRAADGETAGAVLAATDVSAPFRARELLSELEARHRSLTERLPVVTYVHAVGDRAATSHVSPQVQDLLGFSPEEWLAEPDLFWRLVHPEDRERVAAELSAANGSGRPLRSEYRLLSRQGRVVWVLDESVTVRDARGEPLCVQGYLMDVGERRRAEEERERLLAAERAAGAEALRRQRRLDFLAETSVLLASSLEYETTLARVAELSVRDLADWCVVDLVDEEGTPSRLTIAKGISEAASSAEPGADPEPEVTEVLSSGRPQLTPSRMSVPLLARGRALGAVTFVTASPGRAYGADDLSLAQNLAQAAALAVDNGRLYREVEERADASRVLTYVGDGVCFVDRAGVVRLWNPAAEAITGLTAASVLGRSATDAVTGWQALADRIPVTASREPVHAETLPIETEEGDRWISISGVEFFGGTVYAFRDLTDERRLEELKAEFVATASHELRTPLAAVYGAAQTLRRHDFALDEAGRERFVSLIVDESERLGRIVNEILLASQLDAGRLDMASEPFDASDLLERVVESVRTHLPPRVELQIAGGDSVPPVDADRDKVRQVLVNLLENAIKYSPDGGLIEVGVEPGSSVVRFYVRDEGLGIPTDEQARIFEKFYRLDPDMTRGVGGTGLGLYICSELVERMRGRIWVESNPGEGSTFLFELPPAEPIAVRSAPLERRFDGDNDGDG
jgi:PAS domain S-box-containing protein